MADIEVDFDVYKALTARRPTEGTSYNDVLRELLGLSAQKSAAAMPVPEGWVTKGVRFPNGTDFRATHKGQTYHGKVQSGGLVVNNEQFGSPSAAASKITGNPTNGWIFWESRMPGQSRWQIIKSLRK